MATCSDFRGFSGVGGRVGSSWFQGAVYSEACGSRLLDRVGKVFFCLLVSRLVPLAWVVAYFLWRVELFILAAVLAGGGAVAWHKLKGFKETVLRYHQRAREMAANFPGADVIDALSEEVAVEELGLGALSAGTRAKWRLAAPSFPVTSTIPRPSR